MKNKHLAERIKFLEKNEEDWAPTQQKTDAIIVDVDINKNKQDTLLDDCGKTKNEFTLINTSFQQK